MNCKPDDLAWVIASPQNPANVGRIVLVLKPFEAGDAGIRQVNGGYGGFCWLVEGVGSALWDCDQSVRRRQRAYEDGALRPIRPGDITDEEVRDLYAPKQTEAA